MKTIFFYLSFGLLLLQFTACQNSNSNAENPRFNLEKDDHNPSDEQYQPPAGSTSNQTKVDLREIPNAFPPVFAQGSINSCSANAVSAAIYFDMVKQNWRKPFVPSRLFIYYNERDLEGNLDEEKFGKIGAPVSLRDCIKSVHEQGYCPENMWPYDTEKLYIKPPAAAFDSARLHHSYSYQRIKNNINHLKHCLEEGFPFLFGFTVYPAFESAAAGQTGFVPMPKAGEKSIGGHAVIAVGYDDAKQQFIFRNSFGSGWGEDGYGYFPYEYLTKYGFDFWVLKKVL